MHAVSIIVPTLNEAANIDILLKRIFSIEALQSYDFEIIFSDSSSTDTTCERIEKWFYTQKVRLVHTDSNEGLAAAVMKAAAAASGEYLVVIDADLSHPPEAIPELIDPLVNDAYDMVIGSRYIEGGSTPDWPFSRKLSSVLATLPARLLTDVKDPLAGFIALRRDRLVSIHDKVYGFKIGLELLATGGEKMRVKEVPIVFRDRQYGTSKMEARVVIDYIHQLLILTGIHLFPGGVASVCKILFAAFFIDTAFLTFGLEHGLSLGVSQGGGFLLASLAAGLWTIRNVHTTYGGGKQNRILPNHVFGWCWITLLVIFLRTGFAVALGVNSQEVSTVSVAVMSVFGILVGYGGIVAYVFSIGKKRICEQLVHRFYGVGIIVYLALLRLVYCAGLDLLPEEQHYQTIIQKADSFLDLFIMPVPAVIAMTFQSVFAGSLLGFRLGIWLLWFVSALCVFNYTKEMYNRSVAFRSVLLYSIFPFFFGTGLYVSNDAVLTMVWCGVVYSTYRLLVKAISSAWIWTGIILGFGIQVSGMIVLFIPGIILFLILTTDRGKIFADNRLYLALACMGLTGIPFLLSSTTQAVMSDESFNPWIESLFYGSIPSAVYLPFFLLTPTGLLAGVYACVQWGKIDRNIFFGESGLQQKNRLYLLGMFVLPWSIVLLPGVITYSGLYAASIVWVALFPAMSLHVWGDITATNQGVSIARILHFLWWPTIVVLVSFYSVMLHVQALGWFLE